MVSSTLACHAAGAQRRSDAARQRRLLRDSFETKTFEQYNNPRQLGSSPGLQLERPRLVRGAADPCSPTSSEPARVIEDVICGAASVPPPAGSRGDPRAATLWTANGWRELLLCRAVDARWGPQNGVQGVNSRRRQIVLAAQPHGSVSAARYKFVEAYIRGVAAQAAAILATRAVVRPADPPSALERHHVFSGAADGRCAQRAVRQLDENNFGFAVGVPSAGHPRLSFYMASSARSSARRLRSTTPASRSRCCRSVVVAS